MSTTYTVTQNCSGITSILNKEIKLSLSIDVKISRNPVESNGEKLKLIIKLSKVASNKGKIQKSVCFHIY